MKDRIEDLKQKFNIQTFLMGIVSTVLFMMVTIFAFKLGLGGGALSGAVGLVGSAKLDDEGVAKIMKELVEQNLIQKGTKVEINSVEYREDLRLYEVNMKLGEKSDNVAFLSADGKYFVREVVELEEIKRRRAEQEEAAQKEIERKRNVQVPKVKKPVVEVFVMSYCPYGTQVQKGFLPVIKNLGQKADIQFKFVDYLMHGKKELDENLKQYCVEQMASAKHLDYLECFLGSNGAASDSASCMKEVGIASSTVEKCTAKTDKKFAATEKFNGSSARYPTFDLHKTDNQKYQVKGSPTIIVNGVQVEPNRDANSLLKAVCSGFEEKPQECDTELSTKTPIPGFGLGNTTSAQEGGCAE